MTRALVLGGGGPVGIAWETGLINGLVDAGVDVVRADLIVGTITSAPCAIPYPTSWSRTPAPSEPQGTSTVTGRNGSDRVMRALRLDR